MNVIWRVAAIIVACVPAAAFAAGGHDSVGCSGCHSLHSAKGEMIFAVQPNTKYLNPKTKQPYTGTTALCLACHQEDKNGGQGYAPISQHISHPFGLTTVNPKIAKVPPQLLREGGRFECLGCHDPHPSNPNYKYLRVNVGAKGEKIDQFCGVCHASKADASVQNVAIFSSNDEAAPRQAPAAPAAPAAKKKP
jgi:predicted CXXCH cytochrome family protein